MPNSRSQRKRPSYEPDFSPLVLCTLLVTMGVWLILVNRDIVAISVIVTLMGVCVTMLIHSTRATD